MATGHLARVTRQRGDHRQTYYVSQLTAGLNPGTATVDPPGEDNWPQLKYTLPIWAAVGLGYAIERLKIRG